jgi:hypothetical protein
VVVIIVVAAVAIVAYGVGCYLNAARQGRGAEWRRLFRRAWSSR